MIEAKGVKIYKNAELIEIQEDEENQLDLVVFKLLDIPDEAEDEDDLDNIEDKSE